MTIQEVNENDFIHATRKGKGMEAVLFYTAMCGTCKVAERMLEVVEAASVPVPIYKMNINFAPRLRNAWKISSVPCLALLVDGVPLQMEYAMRSVDYLYELLKGSD